MKCPNCQTQVLDHLPTCPSCHLIFEKWKAMADRPRAIRTAASTHVSLGQGLLFLAAALAALFLWIARTQSGAIWRTDDEEVQVRASRPAAVAGAPSCLFLGSVVNLLNGRPVIGAIVRLGEAKVVTDGSGRYQLRVPAVEGVCVPEVALNHPGFKSGRYWTGDLQKETLEARIKMVLAKEEKSGPTALADETAEVIFSLFPKNMTPAEASLFRMLGGE